METIPSNVIPYLIGTPVFALFTWRGYKNYKRLHNPLSGYFALSGLLATLSFAFWSIPLLFTHNPTTLAYLNAFSDIFLYVLYVVSAALVYYLALRQRMPRAVFMTPIIILAVIGWISHAYGYIHNGITIIDNQFGYQLPPISTFIQTIMLANIILVGVFLLTKLPEQDTSRSKFGLVAVALLYLLSGLAGTLNVVLADGIKGPIIIGAYLAGFVFFVVIMLIIRLRKSPPANPVVSGPR